LGLKKSATEIEKTNSKSENNTARTVAKPFLKWAGGKGQLLEKFREFYPAELKEKKIQNFYEPFLGSGAVFFDVVQRYQIKNAFLYDINEELILTYQVIQKDVTHLLELLHNYEKKYHTLGKEKQQEFFYQQRTRYNTQRAKTDYSKLTDHSAVRAAQLIFLNRTCFNGLYRVNLKGEFNSPAGDYKNPKICDEKNLVAVNKILQIAEIKKAEFKEVLHDLKAKSFVYFDPPYRPISKTASFKAYAKDNFDDAAQRELAEVFQKLDEKGAKLMLSNSDPKNHDPKDNFFDELYKDYHIMRVPAKRMINSNANKRGSINEIVVKNYTVQ
jgi:DNA adenine methylase